MRSLKTQKNDNLKRAVDSFFRKLKKRTVDVSCLIKMQIAIGIRTNKTAKSIREAVSFGFEAEKGIKNTPIVA